MDSEADLQAHGLPGGCTMASSATLHNSRPCHKPPPQKNRNRFLFLAQLVAVAGGVLIFGGGSYCV